MVLDSPAAFGLLLAKKNPFLLHERIKSVESKSCKSCSAITEEGEGIAALPSHFPGSNHHRVPLIKYTGKIKCYTLPYTF